MLRGDDEQGENVSRSAGSMLGCAAQFDDDPHRRRDQQGRRIETRRRSSKPYFGNGMAEDGCNRVPQSISHADQRRKKVCRQAKNPSAVEEARRRREQNDDQRDQSAQPDIETKRRHGQPRPAHMQGGDRRVPHAEKAGKRFVGNVQGERGA